MDRTKRKAYSNESYRRHEHDMPLKKESEPSSGFGLANILNRSTSSSASDSATPKFSLPSLHSFGKPLLTKPEVPIAPQHYEEENRYVSTRHQQRSADSSPVRQTSPSPNSRRIAPAPADEDEAEQDSESMAATTRGGTVNQPIRGGRWTADEHERFLEGFRIHGHKWKRVQQVVRTRSVTQVRTHAQKYLLKVAKLKAEKKQSSKTPEMATLAAEQPGSGGGDSVDGNNTAPSTPEHDAAQDSPRKTPRKKVRRLDPGNCDPVDQEYIAAAATTLCFLMSQKIDSLLDTRHEPQGEGNKADYEPYDCYAPQTAAQPDTEHSEHSESRKRSYMHFITDQQEGYSSSYDTTHGEPSSYSIEGSKLCS
ncbi:Myb-like DNA-binding domain [Phytophthora infestans]|uniref:Myb-like DNA-binding domain n=1 Tax=Phytophthora infestans TaxID=4787 RepID=A0A8S9U2Q7_PHYIN|nr:Myb-like DNA-binding domain [Phytophthora infestans]